jgi:hypothetical protein
VIVNAKTTFASYIPIRYPGSLLAVSFRTAESNIGFSIEVVGSMTLEGGVRKEKGNKVFERVTQYDSHLKEIRKCLLIEKPALYKIIWHNSYSHTKSKQLEYKLRVLKPAQDPTTSTPHPDLSSLLTLPGSEMSESDIVSY